MGSRFGKSCGGCEEGVQILDLYLQAFGETVHAVLSHYYGSQCFEEYLRRCDNNFLSYEAFANGNLIVNNFVYCI